MKRKISFEIDTTTEYSRCTIWGESLALHILPYKFESPGIHVEWYDGHHYLFVVPMLLEIAYSRTYNESPIIDKILNYFSERDSENA